MRQRFLIYFFGWSISQLKAMHEIANLNLVQSFTVPPSPGDSGAALGAANFGNFVLKNKFIKKTPLFFSSNFFYPQTNIFSKLFKEFSNSKNFLSIISNLLVNGEIICIFEGAKQVRALNRSIICSTKLQKTLKIKY